MEQPTRLESVDFLVNGEVKQTIPCPEGGSMEFQFPEPVMLDKHADRVSLRFNFEEVA